MSPPLAFVTGGTGFLGGHLCRRLRLRGWRVVRLRRTASGSISADGLEDVIGDIEDGQSVLSAMPQDCDAVFHLAADISHWRGADIAQNKTNILGTRHVARAALARRAKRLIHCSSDAVWGLEIPMLREDIPRRGAEASLNYHRSKFWAEEEIRCAADQGLEAVTINPANIMGPGDKHGWATFAVAIARGITRAAPPGAGAFVHVEAVADAMIAAVEFGRPGHNYLLGGVNASYQELALLCAARLNRPFPKRPQSAAAVLREARRQERAASLDGRAPGLSLDTARVLCANVAVDSSKAIRELGFQARPLDELVSHAITSLQHDGLLPVQAP